MLGFLQFQQHVFKFSNGSGWGSTNTFQIVVLIFCFSPAGNPQGTYKKPAPAGNLQETYRKHAGNIHETYWEHSGNM